jgi:putative ABC transport system permease protein
MSVPVATRQLLFRKGRTLGGLVGIAAALLRVLALKAIFAGMEDRLTAYIEGSGADVIVAQRGVQTMHMTQSALPERAVTVVGAVPGVARATPILYVPATIQRGPKRGLAYLIGDETGGMTMKLSRGRPAGRDGIVLDRGLADQLGAPVGSSVRAFGHRFQVTGEVTGFTLLTNSFAFVRRKDLGRTLRSPNVVSYILVMAKPGLAAEEVARRIEASVPEVTASTRQVFAASERRVVGDMSTDVVRAMILVGFVIGVAVAGLVAYSASLAQLRDYAVLRALGMRARRAIGLGVAQAATTVTAGLLLAIGLFWALAQLLPALSPALALAIEPGDVVQTVAIAGAVAVGAAAIPAIRVSRVDPASVFRR